MIVERKKTALLLIPFVVAMNACMSGPDSECSLGEAKCEGSTAYSCVSANDDWYDYNIWSKEDCGEKFCKVTGGSAVCSFSDSPDPLCDSNSYSHVCDSSVIVTCTGGYRIEEEDCGAGFCVSDGFCALASLEDANCQDRCPDSISYCEFCEDNTIVSCRKDYRISEFDCGVNTCVEGVFNDERYANCT
ncbi:MAG TPA: hypothetical protein VI895_07580 [Bdellovibrionota bacterium]|nr:hypothetical protein [Bdellovibrionota bacterium]